MLFYCISKRTLTLANKNIAILGRILLLGSLARQCTLHKYPRLALIVTTIQCLPKSRSVRILLQASPNPETATTWTAFPPNSNHRPSGACRVAYTTNYSTRLQEMLYPRCFIISSQSSTKEAAGTLHCDSLFWAGT